jgi:hypothetical protein
MNIAKLCCLFITPLFLFFNHPAFAYIEQETAVIRVMNKAAGKTKVVYAPVGKTLLHDGLTITVKNCKKSDPFDAENFFAFLEIHTKTDGRIFSGWMNRNEPGQNPLQHDSYDVWLEKCE